MGCLDFLLPLKLANAEIRVLEGSAQGRVVHVAFLLKTLRVEKKSEFAAVPVPGLSSEPLQFLRGRARTLSMVLYFDGRDTGTDILQPMNDVSGLMRVDPDTHAPPRLRFQWQSFELRCVLETLRAEFSSLHANGRPSRGRMHARFTEMRTVEEILQEENLQ